MRAQGFPATVGYLDDFWACCPTAAEAQEALLLLGDVLRFLGLEVAEEKCEGPVQDIVFLGVRLCTNADGEGCVTASLPGEKVLRLRTRVLALAEKGWARRKDLERLMGQLAFASRVVDGHGSIQAVALRDFFVACPMGHPTEGEVGAIEEKELRDLEDGLSHYTMNAVAGNTRSTYETRGCLLAFGACLRKATVTAKKKNAFPGTGVMLKKSIRSEGHAKMRVMVSFSKTNQFSERTHETLIHEVPGLTAFCAVETLLNPPLRNSD
ncbi:hypothetical protein CYMTET_56451 [Cymbomonas tetramitiformis]|uniref:Reverse transcriptase domain-containing protein n=1 Tax=Cymbomonas tetramitiformis TaxID=36881 RepID=A0AAE0ENR5_9CHLO|nr:hypothetical protein CYMTET_56451 [Cymbomonas tetramitiformis]